MARDVSNMSGMSEGTIFERLSGPLSVGALLRAHRTTHGFTTAEMEKKLKLPKGRLAQLEAGKKKLTLKEVVTYAKKLEEYPEFYALIWMKEQARDAGLNLDHYLRSPAD